MYRGLIIFLVAKIGFMLLLRQALKHNLKRYYEANPDALKIQPPL